MVKSENSEFRVPSSEFHCGPEGILSVLLVALTIWRDFRKIPRHAN